jgi:tetratricopeptide (TPR) repeat protein
MEDELASLLRRAELDERRHRVEAAAQDARARGESAESVRLWRQVLEIASEARDDDTKWYVEGRLADALVDAGQNEDAKSLLEASLASGNWYPNASVALMRLYMEQGAYRDGFRIQRNMWLRDVERARTQGRPPSVPAILMASFAKWWKETGSIEPISLAEQWAQEAKSREGWFLVRHERAQWMEKHDEVVSALSLYLELVESGTRHDATYTRAMILLDRMKRTDESLALAHKILSLGLSASLEEQARKRIVRLEEKADKSVGKKGTKRGSQASKPPVPAFTVRSGDSALRWVGQLQITGGMSSIYATPTGVFAMGGTAPGLWWIDGGTAEPVYLRSIPKRTSLHIGQATALVSDEGTVSKGASRVEMLGDGWDTIGSFDLPGVTSEIAQTSWGIAIGCRAGSLYALDWSGHLRWRFDMPETSEPSPFGERCPYYVSGLPREESVVFSSHGDVYSLNARGELAWKWRVPATAHVIGDGAMSISVGFPPSVSALQATRDGGAWIASREGGIYRVDGHGTLVSSFVVGHNTWQLLTDEDGKLVALRHSKGVSVALEDGTFANVVEWTSKQGVARSPDGRMILVTEDRLLRVLDAAGRAFAVVEFSKSITEAGFVGPRIVVGAGKLVAFEVVS